MNINFKWDIVSVDNQIKTMVVKYTRLDTNEFELYNIPTPLVGESIEAHVLMYQPVTKWMTTINEHQQIIAGASGTGEFNATKPVLADVAQADAMREIELTAIVQKVLAEIPKNSV